MQLFDLAAENQAQWPPSKPAPLPARHLQTCTSVAAMAWGLLAGRRITNHKSSSDRAAALLAVGWPCSRFQRARRPALVLLKVWLAPLRRLLTHVQWFKERNCLWQHGVRWRVDNTHETPRNHHRRTPPLRARSLATDQSQTKKGHFASLPTRMMFMYLGSAVEVIVLARALVIHHVPAHPKNSVSWSPQSGPPHSAAGHPRCV